MKEVNVKGLADGRLEIALTGEIDSGSADEFYAVVSDAYRHTPGDIAFDCTGLEFIDSTTLGTFVKILKLVKTDVHSLRLTGLQPRIKKLFLICSLDTIMGID